MTDESKPDFNAAMSAIRAWYYSEIREWATALDKEIADGEHKDREAFHDYLHESIDGCAMVIYTAQSQAVCLASDNSDALAEEHGDDAVVEDGSIRWGAMAYCAIERDLIETMSSDLDDDATFEREEEEEEEEEETA